MLSFEYRVLQNKISCRLRKMSIAIKSVNVTKLWNSHCMAIFHFSTCDWLFSFFSIVSQARELGI